MSLSSRGKNITLILIVVACVALVILLTYSGEKPVKTASEGGSAPVLSVADGTNGRNIPASEFSGKVLFVNFWASWCQPCKEEMPSIEALYREMSLSDKFQMVTILYKDTPSTALEYMKSHGYTFPVYVDPDGKTSKRYGVTGVPETYIVDRKGNLVKKVIGGLDWSSPEVKSFIKTLLSQ